MHQAPLSNYQRSCKAPLAEKMMQPKKSSQRKFSK